MTRLARYTYTMTPSFPHTGSCFLADEAATLAFGLRKGSAIDVLRNLLIHVFVAIALDEVFSRRPHGV